MSVHVEQKHDDLDASDDEIGCIVALERDRDALHAIQHDALAGRKAHVLYCVKCNGVICKAHW